MTTAFAVFDFITTHLDTAVWGALAAAGVLAQLAAVTNLGWLGRVSTGLASAVQFAAGNWGKAVNAEQILEAYRSGGPDAAVAAIERLIGTPAASPATPDEKRMILARTTASVGQPAPAPPLKLPGVITLLIITAGLSASSCALSPGETRALQVACQLDAEYQPVLVPLAAGLVPALAPIAATDEALVHPAVIAACAAIGGKPVAVTVVAPH